MAAVENTWNAVIPWILPTSIAIGGWIGGYVVEAVLIGRLRAWATGSGWEGAQIVIESLRGMTRLWVTVIGLYLATAAIPAGILEAQHHELFANLMKVVLMISATVVSARLITALVTLYARKYEGFGSSSIITNVVRMAVYAIGLLVGLQTLGFQITPILTALGVGGLAIALAMQDTLAQLFAGIHIVVSREIRSGDHVRLESGEEGLIADITWRTVTIRTATNNLILVPNTKLAGAIITNFAKPEKALRIAVPVGVAYGSDLERVERVALEVAKAVQDATAGGDKAWDPLLRFTAFGESSVDMNVILSAESYADQFVVRHQFIKALHGRFAQEGIEIPFPIRTVIQKPA